MNRFINKKDKKQEAKIPTKKNKFTRLRGMRDVLFDEYHYWDLVSKKAYDLARDYGFNPIKIPLLEKKELYENFIGKKTNTVIKKLYNFADNGGDKVAIRPEATLGITRAYIEATLFNKPQPIKLCWLGPVFKYNSQSGTSREFNQFDLKIFGQDNSIAEVQLILIAYNFFRELQINVEIQLNSVGCKECRKIYIEELKTFYKQRQKKIKLSQECRKKINKNPLDILRCEDKKCSDAIQEAPQILDSICEECKNHFVKVLEYLDELEIPYNLNPFLMKEADYYTKTIFEIYPANTEKQEKQHSLGGGGRFDDLVNELTGLPVSACGFSINLEKAISKIKENNIFLKPTTEKIIFLAQLGEKAKIKAFNLFEDLRRAGFKIAQSLTKNDLKSQLEEAKAEKVKLILILGQKEVANNTILIRDATSGIQEIINYDIITDELKKRIKEIK